MSNKKKSKPKQAKSAAPKAKGGLLNRSKSKRDCKACFDMLNLNIKVNPTKFSYDFEKLKYFTNLYQ